MATRDQNAKADGEHWLFGLVIDEEIQWGAIRATKRGYVGDLHLGSFGRMGNSTDDPFDLQRHLEACLKALKRQRKWQWIFNEVESVGVSSIGLVEHRSRLLTRIALKNWLPRNPIIDFSSLFRGLFDQIDVDLVGSPIGPKLYVQNDATAKCLAEYYHLGKDRPHSLFYVMITEGVNCGFVREGIPFITELHTEIGHVYPRPHFQDQNFDIKKSGCPVHGYCFEGLASNVRIRNSWGDSCLELLQDAPEKPWNIIAYYVAQLCMLGALAVSPERIVIGGPVVFRDLLPLIRKAFEGLNRGDFKALDSLDFASSKIDTRQSRYLDYPAMTDTENFIRYRKLGDNVGLLGALELARLGSFSHHLLSPPRRQGTE